MGMYAKKVMEVATMKEHDTHYPTMHTVSLHPRLKGIKIVPATQSLEVGQTFTLKCQPVPWNADMVEVSWSVVDNSIITVNKDGLITAKKAGVTEVRAKADDEDIAVVVCKVTVVAKPEPEPEIPDEDEPSSNGNEEEVVVKKTTNK